MFNENFQRNPSGPQLIQFSIHEQWVRTVSTNR